MWTVIGTALLAGSAGFIGGAWWVLACLDLIDQGDES